MSNTRLGAALKQYCWQKNITTRDLAADWDCSHTTVSRLLNGKDVSQQVFLKAMQWLTQDEAVDE
jgi:transcriptional regulator with XRE-family HTH domain